MSETERAAARAAEISHIVGILTFSTVVLLAILVIDVVIEIYRMYQRPKDRR